MASDILSVNVLDYQLNVLHLHVLGQEFACLFFYESKIDHVILFSIIKYFLYIAHKC